VEHPVGIGMDTSKRVFQVHGVDAFERACLRKKLSRDATTALFKAMLPTMIGIEACRPAHHWVRTLSEIASHWILLAKLSGCGWRGDGTDGCGLPGPFAWGAGEPVADTAEVDGGCGKHVLAVRLGQPDGAGPSQVHDAGAQ